MSTPWAHARASASLTNGYLENSHDDLAHERLAAGVQGSNVRIVALRMGMPDGADALLLSVLQSTTPPLTNLRAYMLRVRCRRACNFTAM